jgi:uncharacterized protein (TIGR02679 family)
MSEPHCPGPPDLPRLRRLLGTPELAWLVARVRRRLEREEPLTGTVSFRSPTQAQRAAVERLLGRAPGQGTTLSVPLPAVDTLLRRSGACPDGLAVAVTALTGAVTPLRETARQEADAWQAAYAPLARLRSERPEFAEWYQRLRSGGLVRRLTRGPADAGALLRELAAVLCALPASGTELGVFAARVCGDAHALDDDRRLATLVLNAVRAVYGAPAGTGAERRRETWALVGLLKDELSTTVLTLGLPGDDTSCTGRALAALREAGQPAVLTLRQLVRAPPAPFTATVHICENPAVVSAAAERLGPDCPPLVCTQGQPGAAALALLRHLSGAGCALRYHGDFDWGGLRIANALLRRVPWQPWHYTTGDYRKAAAHARTALTGSATAADWDPGLGPAMGGRGLRVEEELVLGTLLADLERQLTTPAVPDYSGALKRGGASVG